MDKQTRTHAPYGVQELQSRTAVIRKNKRYGGLGKPVGMEKLNKSFLVWLSKFSYKREN